MGRVTTAALRLIALAVAVEFIALAALAQVDGPEETFSAAIDVELLDLQIVVTDSQGDRVHGLPADAFRILVDGEEAPIELFTEVREPESAAGPTESVEPATSTGSTPPRTPVNYLVFIDDLMTLKRNRNFVLARVRQDLELLHPGDRMAIIRLAQHRKLQVLADWTSNRAALADVLQEAMELDAWGIKYIALRRMTSYIANWEGNDTRRSVLAAAGAMRLLDRPPGRRALLLVAGSWDPLEVDRADVFSLWCVTGDCEYAGVFDVLTDTANLFGYAAYAIDVEGRDPDADWNREKRLHSVLGELARVTGGKRLLNGGRGRMLEEAIEDTGSYYSVAVTPPPEAPEHRLRIEIEMLRDGLQARSQTAFVPLSAERDRQLDVLAALWLEEGAAESPLNLRLGPVSRLGGGRVRLVSHLAIPAAVLKWRTMGAQQYADLTLEVASVSQGGDSSEVLDRRVRVLRSRQASKAHGAEVEIVVPWTLELPRRRHTIVAGLQDHVAGESFTVVGEISPRDAPQRPTAEILAAGSLPN